MLLEFNIANVGFFLTFLTYIVYVTTRFAKLENEVRHLADDIDDFHDIKQLVYEIHAQNKVLLSMKSSSSQ